MKQDIGVMPAVFPMPVLMIATYDEKGKVDVMTCGWGQTADRDTIALFISEGHKTTKNIKIRGAFTVSIADRAHLKEADFFGTASGYDMEDKFERTGLHARPSDYVDAPVIEEFPLVMECELADIIDSSIYAVIGHVINVAADTSVLDSRHRVDAAKLDALLIDTFRNEYHVIGEKVGTAWHEGRELMRK